VSCTVRDVVLLHPVHQHSYHVAEALEEAGRLLRFHTIMYFDDRFISRAQHRLRPLLSRRNHPGLAGRVSSHPRYAPPTLIRTAGVIPAIPAQRLEWMAFRRFDRYLARHLPWPDIRVVHAFEGMTPLTLQAAKAAGKQVVLDVAYASDPDKPAAWRLDHRLSDIFLVPSVQVAGYLTAVGVSRDAIEAVPYGVDLDRFVPHPITYRADPRLEVLFVGGDTERKGLSVLLEAMGSGTLADKLRLTIVGATDPAGSKLKRANPQHRWLGSLPKGSVHGEFRKADIFVLPTKREGSALVVLEAMASGLAVVTTRAAGSPIIDGQDGLLVDDVVALRRALERLVGDASLRRRLGVAARAHVEMDLSWESYRRRLREVYSNM
jgi:glycosyltransferase involved in cell wall biosynthesis